MILRQYDRNSNENLTGGHLHEKLPENISSKDDV